ncbi:MAG: hypothetical protein KBG15_15525 [Kofleriaceae bacterium]|nr:hypothetical protein [Kofleriaceae bacterium]
MSSNKLITIAVVAGVATTLVGAHTLRVAANASRGKSQIAEAPFAPSPTAAPFVALGYRELGADVFSLRLMGYFASTGDQAAGTAGLVEAVIALDPRYVRNYEFGARAITLADGGLDNAAYLRAIAILERGAKEFPANWKLPYLASQIYIQDLQTDDAAQRRAWDEKGLMAAESAIHKPGAPSETASLIAMMRTKFGQKQRATTELREMLLVTEDKAARQRLIDKLAGLESDSADEIAAEIFSARTAFEKQWQRARPGLPATMYAVLGDPVTPAFDLATIASGGESVFGMSFERLPPLDDATPGPAAAVPSTP